MASSSREFDEAASTQIDTIVRGEEEIAGAWVLICGSGGCTERDLVAARPGQDPRVFQLAISSFNAAGHARRTELTSGELLVTDEVHSAGAPALTGYVLITVKEERIVAALSKLRQTLMIALLIGTVLFLALVVVLSRLLIVRPINVDAADGLAAVRGRSLGPGGGRGHPRAGPAGRGAQRHRPGPCATRWAGCAAWPRAWRR